MNVLYVGEAVLSIPPYTIPRSRFCVQVDWICKHLPTQD